jgi:hypothetical protein
MDSISNVGKSQPAVPRPSPTANMLRSPSPSTVTSSENGMEPISEGETIDEDYGPRFSRESKGKWIEDGDGMSRYSCAAEDNPAIANPRPPTSMVFMHCLNFSARRSDVSLKATAHWVNHNIPLLQEFASRQISPPLINRVSVEVSPFYIVLESKSDVA